MNLEPAPLGSPPTPSPKRPSTPTSKLSAQLRAREPLTYPIYRGQREVLMNGPRASVWVSLSF